MSTVIKWRVAPPVNGCRWCEVERGLHCRRWAASARWHTWTAPTDAQRKARMLAHRAHRITSLEK